MWLASGRRHACGVSGEHEGKRLERRKRRCKDNIEMDLKEMEWQRADWIRLAQDVEEWQILVNAVMNLRIP